MRNTYAERRETFFQRALHPERALALGFLALILVGTLVLLLPFASLDHISVGVHDALFTATSAVCVTALLTVDISDTFSMFGKIVIIILIQIGALGFMAFATLVMVAMGKRISLRNRVLIRESMNLNSLGGLVRLTKWMLSLVLLSEAAGALILCFRFVPMYGFGQGIWYSIFHSISAFCNAGFDLFGGFQSLAQFRHDPLVLLTVSVLTIFGGLGFTVISEVLQNRFRFSRFQLHTKLVLVISGILLLTGTLLLLGLEWNNPKTLGAEDFTFWDKLLNAFFQSATLRSAGFATIDQTAQTDTTKLISSFYMFIGASSASTGGGVKTTTMSVVILLVLSIIRGRDTVDVFGKQLSQDTVKRSFAIVSISFSIVILCAIALSISESGNGKNMLDLLYEAVGAFSTTGLTTVRTYTLQPFSQWLLLPLMYFGRVGPLTMAFALAHRMESNPKNRIHYPEDKIMIG